MYGEQSRDQKKMPLGQCPNNTTPPLLPPLTFLNYVQLQGRLKRRGEGREGQLKEQADITGCTCTGY